MPYIIFNKGREKIYLTTSMYNKLEKKACENLNLPYKNNYGIKIADYSKKAVKAEKQIASWIINFITNVLPEKNYEDLKHFNFCESDAQREIYNLLWAVRGCYSQVDLACKNKPNSFYQLLNAPLVNEKIYIPSVIEWPIGYTFGPKFYLVKTKRASNLIETKRYISSAFEIDVENIIEIKGELTHFYIRFTNHEIIEIEEISWGYLRNDVRITHYCGNMIDIIEEK